MIAKMAGAKPRVAVIGAGPGGIAMGIQLAGGGYDFTIFDRGEGFGGTWRNNTYPGAACDVPSHFYSYSYALNPRWSKTFANQPEILTYLEKVAADNGLGDHLVASSRVTSVRWSDSTTRWTLRDRRRCHATVRRRRHRGGNAGRSQRPRHRRSRPVPRPQIPLVAMGSLQIDCGRACCVHRNGRKRHPIRTGDRAGRRASDGVSADADLGEPPV